MTHWELGLFVGILLIGAVTARGHAADASSVVLLEARQLGKAAKQGVTVTTAGTWHAWAWQRGGKPVTWTLAGTKLRPVAAEGDADHFAWVKLSAVKLPAGKPFPIAFSPASKGAKTGAVAALLLARNAACDPARLWQLARVFPDKPTAAPDERPATCHHLNERFTMPDPTSKAAWERRAKWLREHIRVSTGLWPTPERTPLNAQVFDKIERDGYSIEKVYIASRPGFYACGNLYRPLGRTGPFAAVACPHGHWRQGRFGHEPPRGSAPARFITLARMGCVVFAYDMVGYNDSGKQIGHSFASTRNEAWGLSLMHLQSWNTFRVIDFLQGLPEVDPTRIAVTGCSGGGTQTFMIMGIDPRVTVAAPVNMISGIMQGGCQCENAPLLRIDSCNIEVGALMAPRPLILCSVTGDWTKETPKHEFPKIRSVYQLYGAADHVTNVHDKSPHGYNKVHREAVYNFFLEHLLDREPAKPYTEPPFTLEKKEDLLVWQGRKLPKGTKKRKALETYLVAEARRQRDELLPKAPKDVKPLRDSLGVVYRHAILAELPKANALACEKLGSHTVGDIQVTRLLLGRKGQGDHVPALLYRTKTTPTTSPACLVVHPDGKTGLLNAATGKPAKLLAALLKAGHAVLAIDAYLTGEFHSPFAATKQKKDKKFFSTYNRTAVVQRVQDILTALAWLKGRRSVTGTSVVGVGDAGAWCLLAAPFAPRDTRVAADLAQIGGDTDPRWLADLFTPCILKAGGLWTAAALAAPRPMFVHNVAKDFDTMPLWNAYRSARAEPRLLLQRHPTTPTALTHWLAAN